MLATAGLVREPDLTAAKTLSICLTLPRGPRPPQKSVPPPGSSLRNSGTARRALRPDRGCRFQTLLRRLPCRAQLRMDRHRADAVFPPAGLPGGHFWEIRKI